MKLSRDELIDRIAYASQDNRERLGQKSTDPKTNDSNARKFAAVIVKHFDLLSIATVDRKELVDRIAHASGRNRRLLVDKVRDPEAEATHSRLFATAVIRHLEQSGALSGKSHK